MNARTELKDVGYKLESMIEASVRRMLRQEKMFRVFLLYPLAFSIFCINVQAGVHDQQVADVTTRAFSVIWLSDERVSDATVRVYTDEGGTNEITSQLVVTLISEDYPPALNQGVVKVDIVGLEPDFTYYFETETTSNPSGVITYPLTVPLPSVHTAAVTTRANASNGPIVNDLIMREVYYPDGVTPADGALLVVKLPDDVSKYAVTAFVGEGTDPPLAIVDLNNVFDASGTSAEVTEGTLMEITEFRGLVCDPDNHKLIRFRKVPAHEESPPITELELPSPCFFADTVCDDTIDIGDVQRVLNVWGEVRGSCRFNSDLDIVEDGQLDIGDVQGVLNRWGQSAPFVP